MNLGRVTPDLVMYVIMKQNTNLCENTSPRCTYVINDGMTGCAEINAELGLLIHHTKIVAPFLPRESRTSRHCVADRLHKLM
jgi:hypothetical protein